MKSILNLVIVLFIFACKSKEVTPTITPGLVGAYEGISTKPSYVFQDLLPEYKIFQEKVTVTFSQIGLETYNMEIKLSGNAKKSFDSPSIGYGFTANMTGKKFKNTNKLYLNLEGQYQNLTPTNSSLDKRSKEILGTALLRGYNLELLARIPYQEDAFDIVSLTLSKIK